MNPQHAPIDPVIVEQASHWLMLQWEGPLDAERQQAFDTWHASHAEHRRAWQRLQQLQHTLAAVPVETARSVLDERPRRRAVLRQLGLLLVAGGGSAYLGQHLLPWREALADLRTGTGEVRHLQLADGSQLVLDSDTRVNLDFGPHQRHLQLLQGQLLLSTANDPRPLRVETPAGQVQALGTRFSVQVLDGGARVELFEGRLRIAPRTAPARELEAGRGLWFHAHGLGPERAADLNSIAWSKGRLIAEGQPLGEFLQQLGRYRPGVMRCADEVAALRITGVFPLADSDRVLATLQQTLPIQVQYLTRYWVTVRAR